MAAGVGKTYADARGGQRPPARGRGRRDRLARAARARRDASRMAEGVEVVPPRDVRAPRGGAARDGHGGAVIAAGAGGRAGRRAGPHQRAGPRARQAATPTSTDLRDAGIDVISTVNVQHLESLNDRVFELTGVRVRETIPDAVLLEADELVLVDLPPEALQARLRAGKVYPAERVESALLNFFTAANLGTLREVALREVAGAVDERLQPGGRRRAARRRGGAPGRAGDGGRAARDRRAAARAGRLAQRAPARRRARRGLPLGPARRGRRAPARPAARARGRPGRALPAGRGRGARRDGPGARARARGQPARDAVPGPARHRGALPARAARRAAGARWRGST